MQKLTTEKKRTNKPEWLRVNDVIETFSLKRTKVYELINSGKIKSVSLRERGQMRGTRIISYDSLVAFLEANATGGEELNTESKN